MSNTYDFTIKQGTTFRRTITWADSGGTPIDLTGYTARLQVRDAWSADDTLVEMTTENGGITENGVLGLELLLTATQTGALDFDEAVYDLEVESVGGEVTRLLEGAVTLSRQVTR